MLPLEPSLTPSPKRPRLPIIEILVVPVGVIVFILASKFEAFEHFEVFTRAHDNWQLDEVLIALAAMTVVLAGTSIFRLWHLRADIARRRQAEAALAASEARFQALIEHNAEGISMLAADGTVLYASPAAAQILGAPAGHWIGGNFLTRLHPDDTDQVTQLWTQLLANPQVSLTAQVQYRHFNDTWRWLEVTGTNWLAEPAVQAVVVNYRDITEQHLADRALRQAEVKYRSLIEQIPASIYLAALDEASTPLYLSPQIVQLGYTPAEYLADPLLWDRQKHPDDIERVTAEFSAAKAAAAPFLSEYRLCHPSGREIWLRDESVLVRDEAGQPLFRQGLLLDITTRKRAEAALQQAEGKYRAMVEQIPAIIYMAALDEVGTSLYNGPQIAKLGYTPAQYAADPGLWLRNVHPDDRARVVAEMAQMDAAGSFHSEYRVLHPDGRILWLQDEAVIVRDEAGQPLFQQGVVVDITARKEAEAALAARERRSSALLEHAPDAISIVGADGRLTYASPSARRILGYDPAGVVGTDPTALTHPADLRGLRTKLVALRHRPGQTITALYRYRHQDGSWRWLESNITNLLAEPSVAGLVFNFRDVTERQQHERELEAVVGVSAALRLATSRAQMLQTVLAQVMAVLNLGGASLALRDDATGEMVVELSRGRWAHPTGHRLRPGEGVSGLVVRTGQPYVSANISADPQFALLEIDPGQHAVACVPLIARHDIIGTLWVARAQDITEGEVRLLTAIAEIVASAIQRVTLLETTEQGLARLLALRTIEQAISNSLDLRLTMHILLEQITNLLRVDAVVVLLLHPETQTLAYSTSRGLRAASRSRPEQRLGQGRAGRVALERQPLEVLDVRAAPPGGEPLGEDFRAYIGLPLISKGEVQGVLEIYHRTPLLPTSDWRIFLEALAGQAAIAIDNAQLFTSLQDSNQQLTLAYDATIEGWSAALDLRDRETEGHSQRLTDLTLRLAQAMGVSGDELVHIRRGALLHDIGKMAVPDHILFKPGPLTDDEWLVMRQHPQQAYALLAGIKYLRPALDIPYCHHEKWDGSGYPRGLKGPQIPRAARIFAVVDVWDALWSNRPYRTGWSPDKIRAYILEQSGQHFDPAAVAAFMQLDVTTLYADVAALPEP